MRVAIYSRVSTAHQDQKPEVQQEALRKYCESREWTVVADLVDHGFSGATEQRPGLSHLMGLVRASAVDAVVVTKLDRVARSLKHLIKFLDELRGNGVVFISTGDNIDLSSAAGRLMLHILGAFGEFERALVRERTVAGLAYAKSRGQTLGRPNARNDASIRSLRALGLSYTQIQGQLGCSRGAIFRSLKAVSKTLEKNAFQVAERTRHGKGR